ncbi:RagB/SusD family nutrient uptake outer membrane protein [Pedobacter caeni]|uniref:Starch-binding associating with outer membrane n=1 Tax=Pedobacter caeni TaxID=288992 RepID=A0A1M5PA19_9SPHI|nr:RagB/SusD family nutrient uptake outer membrane protein [Pedobacter caeni]SHG98093.1 Starch-binding associating with outer membrane [Pedobacter caeni]
MKRLIYIMTILCCSSTLFSGCKKFLNVVPVDNLTGNNYWQNKKDVEAYTSGMYRQFREKVAGPDARAFYLTFDLRSNAISSTKTHISLLVNNDIKGLQKTTDWNNTGSQGEGYRYYNLSDWKGFYDIIQAANILYVQVDKIPDPAFSPEDRKRYRAEAVFLRNLAYFFMVRLYGDVPYYTKAYNTDPLPRTPMLEVLNKCIADLNVIKEDLPWNYGDPSIVGIRATRGGTLALLMHLNMWVAGFDQGNSSKYYTTVKTLGAELMDNQGNYGLLPLERTKEIFKGRTKEGLFEVLQNSNYGEFFDVRSNLANLMTYYPYRGRATTTTSTAWYETKYMQTLFPQGAADKRLTIWFDQPYVGGAKFQFLKFINVYGGEGVDVRNDDNIIVFRYSDAILLAAEASAELGEDGEAQRLVNLIRERAGALPITTVGSDLKDDIFMERCRELIGEGHFYNDLVRTKRILNDKFNTHPMSVGDFNQRAWTWPIFAAAMTNNPYMQLTDFWK